MLGDKIGSTAIGPSGWALFPLLKGTGGLALTAAIYAGGLLTGYVVGFAATYFFGLGRTAGGVGAVGGGGAVSGVCDSSKEGQDTDPGGNPPP
jgi:PTS system sucrose-specific IIC component